MFDCSRRLEGATLSERRRFLAERVHRPLRVCGVVANKGEPGGGPFWVRNEGESTGQIVESTAGLDLTETGRQHASQLVRSHRLWESYLVQQLGLPADHVHDPAERIEHFIGERMRAALERELDDTSHDPHGRDIPES